MGTASFGVTGSMSRADGGAQAESRDYVIKRDQHGRAIGYNVEGTGKNRGRCGPLEPQGPRSAADRPWNPDPRLRPPDKFVKEGFAVGEHGEDYLRQARVFIDYPAWKTDIRRSWTDFVKNVREEYAKRDILCDWAPGAGVSMRMDVRDKVGVDPSPIELPMACEQGNLWALHGIGPMPKALVKYFGRAVQTGNVLAAMETLTFEEEADALEPLPEDAEENALAEYEEQFDKDALGGQTVAVRVNKPVPDAKPKRTRGPNKPKLNKD